MVYALIGVPVVNYAMGMYSILFRYSFKHSNGAVNFGLDQF